MGIVCCHLKQCVQLAKVPASSPLATKARSTMSVHSTMPAVARLGVLLLSKAMATCINGPLVIWTAAHQIWMVGLTPAAYLLQLRRARNGVLLLWGMMGYLHKVTSAQNVHHQPLLQQHQLQQPEQQHQPQEQQQWIPTGGEYESATT